MTDLENFTVDDVKLGVKDLTGAEITRIYAKVRPHYAVYRTTDRVVICYADDDARATEQRSRIAPLNVVRSEINVQINDWRSKPRYRSHALRYDGLVAGALIIALEGDSASAATTLTQIKSEILDERISKGRYLQLSSGFLTQISAVFLLGTICLWLVTNKDLPLAAMAGAIGAFFSLAVGIRGRTVLPDVIWLDNILDAVLRVQIGIIAGGVLYLLLHADLVTLTISGANLSGAGLTREKAVIVGFLAGFLERLVPDLLTKTTVSGQVAAPRRQDTPGGAAGTGVAPQAAGDPQIRRVQSLLTSAEFYSGPIHGVQDDATKTAINAFLARLGPPTPPEPDATSLEQWLLHFLQDRNWRPGQATTSAPAPLVGQTEDAILAQIGTRLAQLEPPAIEATKAADRVAVLAAMGALEARDPRFQRLGYTGWLKLLGELTGTRGV